MERLRRNRVAGCISLIIVAAIDDCTFPRLSHFGRRATLARSAHTVHPRRLYYQIISFYTRLRAKQNQNALCLGIESNLLQWQVSWPMACLTIQGCSL